MIVGELAQLLAAYPPDLRVVVSGYEEGYDDLEAGLVFVREIRLDAGKKWWEEGIAIPKTPGLKAARWLTPWRCTVS